MALRKFRHYAFQANAPVGGIDATNGVPVVTDAATNFFTCGGLPLMVKNDQQNDDIGFTRNANGWVIPNDNTADDGIEIVAQVIDAADQPSQFLVGTDPAFYCQAQFIIPDVSDYLIALVGFRAVAAIAATDGCDTEAEIITAYNSVCALDVTAGAMTSHTRLAAGVGTSTATTDAVADGRYVTLRTNVSAAGVVSFLQSVGNGSYTTTLAAPTVNTNTITHAAGVKLMPWMRFVKAANASDTPPILTTWTYGIQ
jgi:hypothetical protein